MPTGQCPLPARLHAGWLDCARKSYAAEGAGVFVQGLSTTLGRAFLVNGAIFSAYEAAHKLLSQRGSGGGGGSTGSGQ